MKKIFSSIRLVIGIIAVFVFCGGIVFALLGIYDFAMVFSHFGAEDKHSIGGYMAIGLLHSVDLFLIAIVFMVLALGILLLFSDGGNAFTATLPQWLHIRSFMHLKVILWEAILTTLVVSYLAGLAEKKILGQPSTINTLFLPGGVLIIALSLYLLKKSEK